MEDVFKGLKEMIDTVIANPEVAQNYIDSLREGEEEATEEEMEIVTKEIGEQAAVERGFVATQIIPNKKEKNYVMVISPLNEHEEESQRVIEDFRDLGKSDSESFYIEGGNITNQQEEAVKTLFSRLIEEQDFKALGIDKLFILNLKIARYLESKATTIIEDNRHFLSSLDEVTPEDPKIEDIKSMLYDSELIRRIKKIGEKFILDGVSFNNDPISFLITKECIHILKENPNLIMLNV